MSPLFLVPVRTHLLVARFKKIRPPTLLFFATLANAPGRPFATPLARYFGFESNEIASTFYSYFARRRTLAPCPKGLTVEYE